MKKHPPLKKIGKFLLGASPLLLCVVLFGGCPRGKAGMPQGDFKLNQRPPTLTPKVDKNTPFRALHVAPGDEEEVDVTSTVLVYFSEAVVTQAGEKGPAEVIQLSPPAKGTTRWLGASLVEFTPEQPLRKNTRYEITLSPALTSLSGKTLTVSGPYAFETQHLKVVDFWGRVSPLVDPEDYDPPVSNDGPFFVRFNQPVNPEALRPLLNIGGKPVKNLEVAQKGESSDQSGALVLKMSPADTLPMGAKIDLVVQEGQFGLEGPLPLLGGHSQSVNTPQPLGFTFSTPDTSYCETGFSIYGTRLVTEKELLAHLTVEPTAPLSSPRPEAAKPREEFHALFNFTAGVTYKVTLSPGLRAESGETLPEAASVSFSIPNGMPIVGFRAPNMILEPAYHETVALMQQNLGPITLWGAPLSVDDLITWWEKEKWPKAYQRHAAPVSSALNVFSREPLQLPQWQTGWAQLVQAEAPPALGACEIKDDETSKPKNYQDTTVLQSSNLAITSKLSPTGATVWVTGLKDGQPVAGASVSALAQAGEPITKGHTGKDGVAWLPLKPNTDDNVRYFVAEKGQDRLVSKADWTEGIRSYEWNLSDWRVAEGETEGHFVLERDLYRPGETVRYALILRHRHGNDLKTQAGFPVELRITSPDGERLATQKLKTDAFGMVSGQFAATGNLEGYLSIEATADDKWVASTGVRLTSFRPIAFETLVNAPADAAWNKPVKADISVRYLAGAPMGDGPVETSLTRQPGTFVDPDGEDYSYVTWAWWEDPYLEGESKTLVRQTLITNSQGEATFQFTPKPEKPTDLPMDYTLEATGQDQSYQRVSARRVVRVHPGPAYVGLRLKDWFLQAGDPLLPQLKVVSPQGKRLKNQKVTVRLERVTYDLVKTLSDWGEVEYVSKENITPAGSCTTTRDACKLRPTQAGEYRVIAQVGEKGQQHRSSAWVYVFGKDTDQTWAAPRHNRVDMVADNKEYHPGQTAHILFKSPFPTARALITVETNKVISRRVEILKGPMARISIPITQDMTPGAYVSVFAVQGRTGEKISQTGEDLGKPTFRMGVIELRVNPEGRRLKVALSHPAAVKPGAMLNVNLKTTDHRGKPCDCQLAVMVVDEAVLKLTGFQVADPMATFYRPQPHGVVTSTSLLHVVGREHYGKKGHNPGGDGKGSGTANLRSDFRLSAYFNPAVRTGPDGTASVQFKLPESLSSFRVMAVALNRKDQFGLGKTNVRTQLPLMVRAALPKFARRGDVLDVAFTVQQTAAEHQRATLTWTMKGGQWLEDPPSSVDLARNTATRVSAWIKPTGEKLELTLMASVGNNRDGVKMTVPVRPGLEPKVVAARQLFRGEGKLSVQPSEYVKREGSRVTVTVAPPLVAGLSRAAQFLAPYPYDCLEQRTSKLEAYLGLVELEKVLGPWLSKTQRNQFNKDLHRLSDYAAEDDNLWALWPGGANGSPYHTARALNLLYHAQRQGLYHGPDPKEQVTALWNWLEKQKNTKTPWPEAELLSLIAVRLWHKPHQALEEAYGGVASSPEARKDYTLYQTLDLIGLLRLTQPALARQLFDHTVADMPLLKGRNVAGTQALRWDAAAGWSFYCGGCEYASLLEHFLAQRPKDPLTDRVALTLQDHLVQHKYLTTYESARAISALGLYARKNHKQLKAFNKATVRAGAIPVALSPVKGQKFTLAKTVTFAPTGSMPWNLTVNTPARAPLLATAAYTIQRGFHLSAAEENGMVLDVDYVARNTQKGLRAGGKVDIQLLMASPELRHQVLLEIPLPAGVEPIDLSLATSEQSEAQSGPEEYDPWCDCYRNRGQEGQRANQRLSPWSIEHTGFYDDKLAIVLRELPKGVSTYTLPALALSAGRLQVSEAQISPMYLPHVYGRAGSRLLTVER